jgi:hypothetical protein
MIKDLNPQNIVMPFGEVLIRKAKGANNAKHKERQKKPLSGTGQTESDKKIKPVT